MYTCKFEVKKSKKAQKRVYSLKTPFAQNIFQYKIYTNPFGPSPSRLAVEAPGRGSVPMYADMALYWYNVYYLVE